MWNDYVCMYEEVFSKQSQKTHASLAWFMTPNTIYASINKKNIF